MRHSSESPSVSNSLQLQGKPVYFVLLGCHQSWSAIIRADDIGQYSRNSFADEGSSVVLREPLVRQARNLLFARRRQFSFGFCDFPRQKQAYVFFCFHVKHHGFSLLVIFLTKLLVVVVSWLLCPASRWLRRPGIIMSLVVVVVSWLLCPASRQARNP